MKERRREITGKTSFDQFLAELREGTVQERCDRIDSFVLTAGQGVDWTNVPREKWDQLAAYWPEPHHFSD